MSDAFLLRFHTALLDPHQEGVSVDVNCLAVELAARRFLPQLSHAHVVILMTDLNIHCVTTCLVCLACVVYWDFAEICFLYMLGRSVTTGNSLVYIRRDIKTTALTLALTVSSTLRSL
jgi:hypothetical protein